MKHEDLGIIDYSSIPSHTGERKARPQRRTKKTLGRSDSRKIKVLSFTTWA